MEEVSASKAHFDFNVEAKEQGEADTRHKKMGSQCETAGGTHRLGDF